MALSTLTTVASGDEIKAADHNNIANALNGTDAKDIKLTSSQNGGFLLQPQVDPSDLTLKQLVLKNQAGTEKFSVAYNGNAHAAGTLTVDGASTLTGALTASSTLTLAGALDANAATNTIAGTVSLGDDQADYLQAAGSAATRPALSAVGASVNVGLDVIAKAAGTVRLKSSTLANYVEATPAATGTPPQLRAAGDANRNLIADGVGSGKLTDAGGNRYMTIGTDLPAGTVMLFWQTAAPTGWTQVVTQNDKALRVVSGVGGGAGGTTAFTSCWVAAATGTEAAHTHSIGAHTHAQSLGVADLAQSGNPLVTSAGAGTMMYVGGAAGGQNRVLSGVDASSGTSGAGSAHSHAVTAYAPQYIDIILCSKAA